MALRKGEAPPASTRQNTERPLPARPVPLAPPVPAQKKAPEPAETAHAESGDKSEVELAARKPVRPQLPHRPSVYAQLAERQQDAQPETETPYGDTVVDWT